MTNVKRAALYPRVSTEEQAKYGYSIKAQIDALTEYCDKNEIKIVDIYADEGVSGGKSAMKRPAMKRLLEDVQAGKIDVILFTRLDRWFRNIKEYYKVQEILEKHSVSWKTILEDYETESSSGRFKVNIMLSVSQNEREKGAERVNTVLENKRKNKEACFGGKYNPFGYKREPDEKGIMRLVMDPETNAACFDFWHTLWVSKSLGAAIRKMIDDYGINKPWTSWTRIAKTDFYSGTYRGVTEFCPPYISPERWALLQTRATFKAPRNNRVYLFKGLMRCPACGKKMAGGATKQRHGEYKAYRCPSRYRGCDFGSGVPEKTLEAYLLENLEAFLRGEIARVKLEQSKPKPKQKNPVKALKERQRRLTVAYMAGSMTDEDYIRDNNDLKAQIAKAEAEAPPAPRDIKPLKELLEIDFKSIYEGLNEEERQRFWLGIISEIKLDGIDVKDVIFF
jgi:DNA invertase Pin-like site-specific DNA recombinase